VSDGKVIDLKGLSQDNASSFGSMDGILEHIGHFVDGPRCNFPNPLGHTLLELTNALPRQPDHVPSGLQRGGR
jgi:hypothetical protein